MAAKPEVHLFFLQKDMKRDKTHKPTFFADALLKQPVADIIKQYWISGSQDGGHQTVSSIVTSQRSDINVIPTVKPMVSRSHS